MERGFRVYNAKGDIILDGTSSLNKVLGYWDTGINNGEITDDRLKDGKPWVCVCEPYLARGGVVTHIGIPIIYIQEHKVYWKMYDKVNDGLCFGYKFMYGIS